MRSPDTSLPPAVSAEIARFCEAARRGDAHPYGQLMRENLIDASMSSFPLACEQLGRSRVEKLVAAFFACHRASLPQFHHIATEFVAYLQARVDLPPGILPLLEYEWLLLAVEIDASTVPSGRSNRGLPRDAPLALNPTARLVVLPFDLTAEKGFADYKAGADYPYALYRTAAHHVITQPLMRQDCLLLEIFRDTDVVLAGTLVRALAPSMSEPDLLGWLAQAINNGLICPTEPN
jgi:uncharacterized protein